MLQAHRRGEGQLFRLYVVQGTESLKEWLLRPERPAAFSKRAKKNAALTERIRKVHQRSRGTYGYPRVHAELRALGVSCSRKRVARLMRKDGLRGCMRGRRKKHTTHQDPLAIQRSYPDLVERNFCATAPNRLWTADITYLPTDEGFLYLAFIRDCVLLPNVSLLGAEPACPS